MKKMNSFGPSSPPTMAAKAADSSQAPAADTGGGAAAAAAKPTTKQQKGGKLAKQLSKSASISKQQDEDKEETPEERFKKFEGEGQSFKAKLVGSELVIEPRGGKMCQNSIQRLKAIIKGQKVHKQRIVMKISFAGVKVYDEKTNEILHHHEVHQISFIASDDTDSRTFGYVCDVPNKAHQFICFRTAGPALQVMTVISSLFEAVLERKRLAATTADGAATPAGKTPAPMSSTPSAGANSSASREQHRDEPGSGPGGSPAAAPVANSASAGQAKSSPFDDDFGRDLATATSGDSNNKDAINTSDLISSTELSEQQQQQQPAPEQQSPSQPHQPKAPQLGAGARATSRDGDNSEGAAIKSTGSKRDIRSYFDDLKDLQISKVDTSPPFHLIHSGVSLAGGVAGGDSGIMDSTTFSDWGALSQSGMSRTNSAAQMSRTSSAAGLNRTNSAGGSLLFEAQYGAGAPASATPSSPFYTPPSTGSGAAAAAPMAPFFASPPDHFGQHLQQPQLSQAQHPYPQQQQQQQQQLQQQRPHGQPPASQAMFIPQRLQSGAGACLFGSQQQQQPTPSMMVPGHHLQQQPQLAQQGQQQQQQQPLLQQAGPGASSMGAIFEPPHANMIVGSAPMNQLSHYQMSQHARFSSSMVAGLHQRLGSSAASIQSTGSAGVLSRQTNPFDDEFFA